MSRTATFTVTLSQVHSLAVTMQYATLDKTAFAGLDFTSVSGTLTFAPGDLSKTVNVPVQAVSDRDLNFMLRLFNVQNGTLAGSSSGKAVVKKDNALVALVAAYQTAKTESTAASAAAVDALAAKDAAQAAYDAAVAARDAALADYNTKNAAATAAETDATNAYNNYTYLYGLALFNPAYQNAALAAQTDYGNKQTIANTKRAEANAALTVYNQKEADRVTANTALTNATNANTTAQAAAATALTAMETARTTAAAGFVGSTSLET